MNMMTKIEADAYGTRPPGPSLSWSWQVAFAAYHAARAAELAYNYDHWLSHYEAAEAAGAQMPPEVECEMQRLTVVRVAAEGRMMAILSPDGAAFAIKFLIASGIDHDDFGAYQHMLRVEAKRLVGPDMAAALMIAGVRD